MRLFRPVGLEELRLIHQAGLRAFPARLPDQPIFYPVTHPGYAREIASAWNTRSGSRGGFVTRFSVDDAWARRFERKVVGAAEHEELWVPADELPAFNGRIEGSIELVDAVFGEGYRGEVPSVGTWAGLDATAQLASLTDAIEPASLVGEHSSAVFLNFPFWETFADAAALARIRRAWEHGPHAPLPLGVHP